MVEIDAILKGVADNLENPKVVDVVEETLQKIERDGPMLKVFEACGGSGDLEPKPPFTALLRCLEMRGHVHSTRASSRDDTYFRLARDTYHRGIEVAMLTSSKRTAARL